MAVDRAPGGQSLSVAEAIPVDRRKAILDAAKTLMANRGSRGTSIAAVAELAGVTDAGVLYHFKTKQNLLLAVLEQLDIEAEERLHASERRGLAFIRLTRDWGERMEQFAEIQSMLIVLTAEHVHAKGPGRDYILRRYGRLKGLFSAAFADAVTAGEVRPDADLEWETTAFVAFLDGLRVQWFLSDRRLSMAESVRSYVDAMLARLEPDPGHEPVPVRKRRRGQ